MKLSYFQLLSNDPVDIGIGHIKIPTVKDRRKLGEFAWWTYAVYSSMTIDNFYEAVFPEDYDKFLSLPYEDRIKVTIFDIMDIPSIQIFVDIFNFYFEEEVIYDIPSKEFHLYKYLNVENEETKELELKKILVGKITRKIFQSALDIISQISNINQEKTREDNLSKYNEKEDPVMFAFIKKRKKLKKKSNQKQDPKYDIGNIISIVSAYGENNINCLNIDDITIPQLYDQFTRIMMDRSYKIGARNVSVWGDKDKKFDPFAYMININEQT